MINPREAGFRVPQRIAGGSPKEGKVAERLARLSSLVDELRANGNFQDAVSEYLNGAQLDSKLDPKLDLQLRALLEFGIAYHKSGLSEALEHVDKENAVVFDITTLRSKSGENGLITVNPSEVLGVESGRVLGIVGARFDTEVRVIFDAVATRINDPIDAEHARLVGINPFTGQIFFSPHFVTGDRRTRTVESAVPPLRFKTS